MSKAEEMAWLAFPNNVVEGVDFNLIPRNCFRAGYEQAEKDLADKAKYSSGWDGFFYGKGYEQAKKDLTLTWEDVQLLDTYVLELVCEERRGKDWGDGEEFYTEVLRRFKEAKK